MTESSASSIWTQYRTTIIAGSVVTALVVGLVGVRIATAGGGDDDGTPVVEAAPSTDATASPRASASPDATTGGASVAEGGGDTTGESTTGDADTSTSTDGSATDGSATDGTSSTSGTSTSTSTTSGSGTTSSTSGTGGSAATATSGTGGTSTPLPGVTDTEISIVYYWRGDRTRTSAYRPNENGNVDEGDAFNKFITYINKHGGADDHATFMGLDFDLHGRTLVGQVLEVGDTTDTYNSNTAKIVDEIKPMAALTSTGSQGEYLCPPLADAGIHNFGIYDLQGGVAAKTDGYCTPAGVPFDRQIDMSIAWLKRLQDGDSSLKFGLIYAEYPSLVNGGPVIEQKLKDAGINLIDTATLPPSLTDAATPAATIARTFQGEGINYVIMPDGLSPLAFTHAAKSAGYIPDYYVWPCSGQDTEGFVRLLEPTQWAGAAGLSCYDESYVSDLTITSKMADSEWYAKYNEVASGGDTPPAQSPFVYAAFLPLLQGITAAGPNLTLENFRAGLDAFQPYRYDMTTGITTDATKILIDIGDPERTPVVDLISVDWNPAKPGGTSPGGYDFPEDRRYRTAAEIR